ncbi:LPD23 domain-containing protein [Segatella hominis]
MTGTLPEDEKQETTDKEPGLIAKVLGMIPTGVQTSNGTYQPSPAISQPVVKGEEMPVKEEASSSSSANAAPVTTPTGVVNNEGLMDAKLANYIEDWKQRPDKEGDYFANMVADLLADGTANSNEEAVNMVMPALHRYANRSAMDVTNQVVSSLPDDTVQDAEQSIDAQWYSHGVQDKLKQEADSMGISYDDYVAHFLKPAMVQSLVNKYGPNYRSIAEGIATRLYSHDENVQDRLMNQDINEALSSVINKYVNPSVVDEYNKAQEAGSKAFNEGMEGSQYIPANLRLGTALGAQYEANEAKDPAKMLSGLQQKFGNLYRNPKFLNDMSNAAFKVMQRYGLNGTLNGDPKQFKPMINSVLKNELDQLEIKGMMPKGSAEYIMKTGLGNTIVGKITRKAMQTDYQNWLEDIANQQYQPGFWENVASGALTFAGDAWSYWLPGAAGGKLTKSMVAKAEGKLAGDLMAKGMERKMAERAAKVLIGKSKAEALKSGAVHGAVTFGGQSAISKPIDEVYRTGQFDENGKIYNPSVGKVIANTLGEVAKQTAVGAIMQGGTIANMVGKGRGLATNILADVGGKVVDSGIMTSHQMLERMAHDPNFKPTGKDAAESFLESMANLTAIGLPGMVGKYARFKDAREFNKKFDFTDQDIAELKRFGYDGLRDAFEKVGIGEYAVEGENAQRLDGQLTQKYMDLMNDKSVPEVLKAKMMAVVEGKRPSSFSPVVDSVIVQPMDNGGKVYLETLNKDGGIIDRKEYSSLDEAQKADKKLEYEKTLGLASVLEGEFHNEFTQEHLEGLYNKAAQKYNMGEKLTDEDKAAVYLHQNAGAIKEIMDKQQKGIILTDEEQKQINAYRHYYDSALENSSVMREFVNTFEDSNGVARGTLRKALESKDKKYAPLVESYLKELYNSIELKREMKQTMDDLYNTSHGNEQKRIEGGNPVSPVEGSAGGQEPPVSEGPASYQDRTKSVPTPSDAEVAANPANVSNSSAEGASPETKVAGSDAFVMGQNAYKNGDSEALQAIDYNSDLATGRLKRAFADNEKMPDIVANAYNEGRDMEQFVAQRASSLTPAQKEAISKYVEAMDAKKGTIDALQHADDGYGEALKEQLWPYQTEDGNIVPATLDSGKQVFLKKANEYGGAFVVVPDEQGQPTIKQVSNAEIREVGTPVPLDEYIESSLAQQKDARNKQFISQFDGSGLKPNDQVTVAMEEGDANINMTFAGYSEDGKIVLTDGKDYLPLSKEEFAAWRKNALDNTINEHLDREDGEREIAELKQAEADKKERFAKGIVGLSEGHPDYSSKDTDAKVAAEYLQEQYGEDHGKLLNLVNGSRDDIKTQLANKRKAAAEYQNWLDTNADLDPEKAKKVEDELSLVNEQIADLDARFKNWNTIRNSVMTPDEVKAMTEERKAEVEKAGVDETAIVPSDDFHVLVLDDKELKKQYPTMDKANDYITSQRKDIYHTQEDVERKINGVNDMLDQYINGETELEPNQLMELNTTKAQLEALQTNLSVAAKGLKAQANKLNKLYKTEVSQQEMEELGMTPSEQRKVLVSDAIKKNDLGAIIKIYKDASVDVTDLTPQTLEEAVSEFLSPHSLNPESLQYELGKSNFKFGIGKGYDSNKFNYLIAKKGTGMSVNEFAVKVYNDLPVNLQDMGYTDQDVRNTLLDMFKSYDSVKEMKNVALMNRIAAAEDELSSEEEFYEAQKEREIIERQAEIEKYKSYIHEKALSLPSESELDHINGLEFDRMMEIEDREREYKQYVKSILPELADYDDRSNEEGYGGGSSLGSDSSRRGVDEGNSQGEEVGNGEASSESEIGEGSDSGRKGRQEVSSMEPGEGSAVRGSHIPQEASFGERLKSAIAETETEPTEAQKKAGNYKKGHLSFGGYDYTVETPKGVTRSGKDEQGKPWSVTMHDTYGYILGKIGVDGDHIDMFINDAADLDTFDGNVYVVDQVNPETGEFDEHKVMYGYPSEEAATEAYLANYSKGWKGLGKVTSVSKATFDKWLESSDRKTKPFAEYAMVQKEQRAAYEEEMMQDGAHSEAFDKIVDLAKEQKEYWDLMEQGEVDPNEVPEVDVAHEMDKLLETLSDEEFKEVSDVLWNMDEEFEYWTANEHERREDLAERKNAAAYSEFLKQETKSIAPFADALRNAVNGGDKKAIAKAQKELTDALLASNLGHGYLSGQLEYAKSAKKKDESYSERRAFIKPLTDAINAIESALDSALADVGLEGVHVDFKEYGYGWIYADKGSDWRDRLEPLDNDYRNVSQYSDVNPISVLPQITMNNVKKVAGIIKSRIEEGERYNSDENQDENIEEAKKAKDNLPFHRDVKEVEPSEMTEAQKVAYDAVSTMLKKAGIPVKVVSNEDMEKVAEAQDNLNLAMLLNQPEMRFKIKTPEEKQAAENAYNFAKELRPDKWKQYAVVDMSNPIKMPEYFEKQELARKERSYYNKLMWGNYKVFNLDKSFEDNVAGLTGSFPSEFDPYKIDEQTSKKNELKKQIKETEEAYKLIGQERKEYQIQLMKEYMDEHGLDSEDDIPDDVWSDLNDKAHEKYQDKLDSLFAKYKDLDRQLKAVAEPGVQYLKGKGVVYGYTDGKEIVLNQEHLNPNTPIHEYQHLWRTAAKEMNPDLIAHGDELIKQTQLFADLKEDPNYKHLSDDEICDEAFARLTGEDGAAILEQMAKDAIKENPLDTAKELTIINRLKNWLKKFWYWTLDTFTKWKPEDIKRMTLEDIRNLVLRDLANGVDPRNVKSRMTKEDAVSLRKQMADNAEQERILEHTEENWQKEFGKDSRVTTPIGSIKLGENQYKKAGRNDRIKRFGLLKPTLERPDVILEKSAPKEGAERQTKYLFIKSFKKADGNKILNYESITVKQGEEEVAISAHQIDPSKVVKELTESKVLWNRFRGDSNSLGENQGSALTPSANNPSGKDSVLNPHSDAKIRNNIETAKGNGGNLSVEDKIMAVSQQFGVDEADVAMYANAIKKGSTAEAARARANIKRHLLQANEDKISSLKELLKYTKPVNEALKENFGDVDAMIEERVKQVEAQRNAMEAARKRAEEEEAKRKKHLEELSVIPDDQLDKQYMDALAKGDDATAREMLDEAARRKGYDDTESSYQGVGAWKAPGNPGYESDKARRDDWESSGSDVNLEDMALGYTPQPDDYFSHPERYSQNTPHGLESVKAINEAIKAIKNGEKDVKVKVYRAVPTSVKEGKLRNGDWVTPSKKYADIHGNNRLEGKYRIIEDEVPATQLWWDGNDANEFGFDDGKEYKYKNAKNSRKLNDLVTYDDKGDVIPPSKRFNSRKSDIRFMFGGEKGAAEADKAEEKTYRMDNLKVAEEMERGKKDAKAIKLATGWERGADGKWRYEMPDAKIKDMKDIGGGNIVKRFDDDMLWNDGKLTDVIDAPGLFEAYPQLKDVRIDTDAIINDMPSNGVYNAKTNTITIHADELKYMNSILNHEIQHAIQYIEGFGKGGSPEQMEKEFKAAQDEWKARAYAHELEEKAKEMGGEYNQSEVEKALVEEYKDLDMSDELPDKETRIKGFNYFARGYADRSMDDAIKRFRLNESTRSDFDSYKEYLKLAGEVESRNVEKRLGMTDEERRNSLASETEDVNRDEQIVMNGNDASYSIVKDPETIKKLDKEDTVKVYRAMQVGEDGKLYPPMAAKVKGKFVQPIELGKWEQADERPELADDKGMFTLNKGNGKSLKAAYNPYLHTSRTPLNDQFSEAQNRPNIVTVEVEVPKSELTSGYKADKAKDAVGEVEWKAGIIQGQLTGKRKVVLSRWDKPVRIVPDSEVADVIVNDMFKGKNITMPSNVVTPSLRKELEKRGVPFVETDNRGRIVGGENDGVHYSKVYGKNHREKGYRSILKFSLGDNGTDIADGNGDSINKNPNKNVITRRIGSREQAQRRVNETLGAAASDRQRSLGATTKEQRTTWNRRSALGYVRRRAEELSSLLTEKDLEEVKGIFVGHGQENYVYRAKYDPTKVIKFNDFGLTDNLFRINEFIDRVNAHNQFQPKDKYTPIGFAYDEKGDFCIVMEQPYLKGTTPTREEITQYLTDHGFKLDMIQISADEVDLGWTNGEFDLWDAEPRNVIKDENGDLHFFDTMIQHTYIPNHKNPLRLSMPSIRTFESQEMKNSADKVKNVANVLGGADAVTYTSSADVPEEYRVAIELGAKGWYDPTTHTVHVYLPNCADANEAQRTVFHEKIGHEGMEVLLGGEDGVRKFANFVYRSVGKNVRGKIIDFANKYDPDWKNPDRMNVGTQEYIAHLAEEGPKTAEDFSLWTKIKHYLIKVLKKLGVRVPGLLNDKDLRYYLMKAGKALHVWDNMPKEKQEAMMKQASNAEIKDALSDGAGKGKPRQKKGESAIQFIKRVREWERWKEAREDTEDPEPPQFYDFDKDIEGKKEWERLNKKWRDSHHLQGDEMPIKPERKEGETDEEFFPRYKEWEKWNDAMADKEDPMPDMFAFEKKKQEEVKRKYEDWLAKHDLLEQQQADLDLYEGKIYPAETNPKADDLEQQVMQDLAEVTSTDVSKEGAARSVHDAVIYRRKNIESASADDAIFINSVKQELNKMANASYLGRKANAIADAVKETVIGKSPKTQAKKMAEAIPYIIEAPRRMRDIADEMNAVGAFENGHIHVTAKDIDAIQPFTDELRVLASKSHKIEKDGKETIVYDDVPSMTEVASKMAKAINDNHVGEEGFVPVDGTDILAEHVLPVVLKRIVPEGVEYKNLSEEMQALLDKIREWYDKTFTWLKDSHTVREDVGYTNDYVNHRWDKKKSDDKAYADLVEGRQRTKSPNEKPRKVSTYMEGVDAGLVPKTTDITDLLGYYSQSNIEAFANKTFLQELSGINVIERNKDGEITSSMPLLSSIQPKEMMVDENKYTPYVVPGINTVWVYNQGKIFNKSAEDWFNAAFGTVKLPKTLKGIKNAMSIAKALELGFSGFHAGALTEVYAVQNSAEFGPAKAMAYFMKYLIADTAKNHQLPAFANPDVFKEAAKHLVKFGSTSDYATADIENLYEKVHSYVARLHSKLVEGNVAMKAGSSVTFPLEVATELLKMSQKGLDVALWSYLHDGLKLATYQLRAERTRERAKKLNWNEDMLNKALDEDGQFVNDMFGGQHFDVLGLSKKMQTILDFIFLSKDWLISTTRHALSIFGYGSIWNEASIKNFMEYYKHVLGRGEMTKEDYLRLSRSKSGLLCYGIGFMIGYEGLSQLVNAAMRAWDEEKQKEKADEIRKTNPSYKSPYELAYPNGMHWYDYLMRGNSLGQQSKIFMGRYADGTEMYIRHGKQFREIPELFFDAKDNFAIPGPMVRRMYGKASPLLRGMIDTYKWYLSPDYGDKEMQRKYGENLGLIPKLGSYYVPFAVPTQKDKEFKMLDLVFPSSKGFSRYKAQDYFKTFIMSEDKQGLAMTYNACVQNGIDPEVQLKAAISSVKALEASEMSDGVTSLQEASKRFDAAKSITEKKKMRQKMKKFLSQSDYKAFTQKEALDMVQGYLNGDEDLKEMEKAESKYLMNAKAEDVTEDWRIQNVWNGTMETYQEYQRLKDVDKAKANAFKNSKTNKRLFAARKVISAARRKMNKAKKQMDGTNDAAKLVEIRNTRKELLEKLNGME